MYELFPKGAYADVPGLCKVATLQEIETQGWSINPGRYVGVAERAVDDFDFKVKLEELNEELEVLNSRLVSWRSELVKMWRCCWRETNETCQDGKTVVLEMF